MDLSMQRRLAADILGVGVGRVWIDPERMEEVSAAISKEDIRSLIYDGAIQTRPEKPSSRGRTRKRNKQLQKGRLSGSGSRKGTKGARLSRKEAWIQKVRPLRRRLRELRDKGKIDSTHYRKLYRMIKGGSFKNKAHLESHLKEKGLLEE